MYIHVAYAIGHAQQAYFLRLASDVDVDGSFLADVQEKWLVVLC